MPDEEYRKMKRDERAKWMSIPENRASFNAKRREQARLGRLAILEIQKPCKDAVATAQCPTCSKKSPTHVKPSSDSEDSSEDEEKQQETKLPNPKVKTLSLSQIKEYLQGLLSDKAGTLKTYITSVTRLFRVTGQENFIDILKNSKESMKSITEGVQANGKPYSINSIRATVQCILFVLDLLKLHITKKDRLVFKKAFDLYSAKSSDETQEKNEQEPTYSWDQYMQKINEHFEPQDKITMIAKVAREVTTRDDLQLEIVKGIAASRDKTKNFILVPSKGPIKVIINRFKTDKKYEPIDATLSPELSKDIRAYIAKEKLTVGDYVFGKQKLTGFVGKNNRLIGINPGEGGAFNYFRHMTASQWNKDHPNATLEQKLEIADAFKHAPVMQTKYLRLKEKD